MSIHTINLSRHNNLGRYLTDQRVNCWRCAGVIGFPIRKVQLNMFDVPTGSDQFLLVNRERFQAGLSNLNLQLECWRTLLSEHVVHVRHEM